MTKRFATRTWPPDPPAPPAPIAQVVDPATRAIFLARRRALLLEAAEIARRCGLDPDTPDDEVA